MAPPRRPVHMNRVAFTHNKNSKKTAIILSMPNQGLCEKCHEIIEWRKRYRKYKPLTVPKKCVDCTQRKVTRAYHLICDDCAKTKHICAKCKEPGPVVNEFKTKEEEQAERVMEQRAIDSMRERERRSYLRQLRKKEREDGEEGDSEDEDDDDEEDGEESAVPKEKKIVSKPKSILKKPQSLDDDDDDEDEGDDDEEDDEEDEIKAPVKAKPASRDPKTLQKKVVVVADPEDEDEDDDDDDEVASLSKDTEKLSLSDKNDNKADSDPSESADQEDDDDQEEGEDDDEEDEE